MALASMADRVLLWIHGRRLGIVGDGQVGTSSALVLDGVVIGSSRGTNLIKAVTSLSAAGSVVFAGLAVGDNVMSVTDLSSDTDVSTSFESTISVAGAIQQLLSTSGHQVLVAVQPQS